MTTKDEALNATMADSALERMAENERELGLDYMEPALEPTTKQKVDAAVEQYAKTGNGRVLEAALGNIIINETLDKMAKNARELGLDYKPAQKDYKAFYDGEKWCSVEVEQPTQQQEPVAWVVEDQNGERLEWAEVAHIGWGWKKLPLYTSPPTSKPWRGLTDEEAVFLIENELLGRGELLDVIEAKLKEKNHG